MLSFEDDDLDNAYKLLEATEKFCDPSRRFASRLRSGNSSLEQVTDSPYERLYRRSLVADCLLFEAVIVFLKQGFSSYVKGGYILRKAWKMYEKINEDMEQLCVTPCPIVVDAVSPQDKHVGTSMFDSNGDVPMGDLGKGQDSVDAITGSLPGLLSDLGEVAEKMEEEMTINNGQEIADNDSDSVDIDIPGFMRRTSDVELISSKKPTSGYCLPEINNPSVKNLDSDESRLRGGVYFGYGLMNIVVSLIPPKLMKLANLFGFHGSRKVGLQALEYSCHSQDMKAPIAR